MTASRRSVLRACGGAVGTGTFAGLAGCSGLLGEDDASGDGTATPDDGGTTTGDDTGSEPPWYANWLPAPGELGHTHYGFTYTGVPDLLSIVDVSGIEGPSDDSQGVDPAKIEHAVIAADDAIGGPTVAVFEGSFDPMAYLEAGAAVETLSEQGTEAGYTLWGADGENPYALGLKEGRTIQGFATDADPMAAVRTAIDTGRGDGERYVDVEEALGSLVSALGQEATVTAQRHDPREDLGGAIGEGSALMVGDSESTVSASVVFPSADDVSPDPVTEWAASTWAFDSSSGLSVETDGAVATVESTMDNGALERATIDLGPAPGAGRAGGPGGQSDTDRPPVADFSFSLDMDPGGPDTGILTITHAGGDAIAVDDLVLSGAGYADVEGADLTDPLQWEGTASGEVDGQPAVVSGDFVDVGVRSDYSVTVVWVGGSGTELLAEDRGPDAIS